MDGGHGDSIDWGDMSFTNNAQALDDFTFSDSPYTNSAFDQFTNMGDYGGNNSPMPLTLRTPSKSEAAAAAGAQNPKAGHSNSENSSQDSSSDTSSRRNHKRKTESESPISDPITEIGNRDAYIKQEDMKMHMGDMSQVQSYDPPFQPMNNLSLEQSLSHGDSSMFNSAASSPVQRTEFEAMSIDAQVHMPHVNVAAQFSQDSPVQTINPGMFTIGGSRDQSPATNSMMFNTASPNNAIFSTPPSDSQEFAQHQNWNPAMAPSANWPGDFNSHLTSPGTLAFTPSPGANGTPAVSTRASGAAARIGMSPLHIAPISTKSRVETQINVVMTLEKPPPGIEHLHLPLHTIAKSKLLAKEEYDRSKALELHTMLVCSSAMHNPQLKEKALQRAAIANNDEIQRRAELARGSSDDEKNDPKNVEEADKPANGGEVRICSNCIQRERKRAGRKKTKREEEQQHWERFETERVVVFNSNEYLSFKPYEGGHQPLREGVESEPYMPPDGSMQVTAAMRIACYCRHQSEKEGFQVIFTMKDQLGNVVAQQISDSILITDDHKTHPQSFSATVAGEGYYQNTAFMPHGLPMSHSMVDMTQHVQPFTSSRSAGNLQALAYGAQFNPHSHVHQLPGSGYTSQTTSATMTPTSLSRPGSPTNAGQAGPNKKRKSSTFHRKVPSGLTMTPRVDTSQPPSSNMPSAVSMTSQFSPSNPGFPNQMNQSYMTIPQESGPAQLYNASGPPTPSENSPFAFTQNQTDLSQIQANQAAYFSHPSSAVPSRSNSPVMHSRGNLATYARQQPIQTPTNSINARPQAMFANQTRPAAGAHDVSPATLPTVQRTIPFEGSTAGGNEVAIIGENFVPGMQVAFGDQIAQTTFISASSLSAMVPSATRPGSVYVSAVPPGQNRALEQSGKPIYKYTQSQEDMMAMALKHLTEQQYGHPDAWQQFAQQNANAYVQQRVSRAGIQQGYPAQHRSANAAPTERMPSTCSKRPSPVVAQGMPVDASTAFRDIADASFYKVEADGNDGDPLSQAIPSRPSMLADPEGISTVEGAPSPGDATLAMRDMLSSQVHRFHETVQSSISHFQPLSSVSEWRRFCSCAAKRPSNSVAKHGSPFGRPQLGVSSASAKATDSVPDSAPPAYYDIFSDQKPTAAESTVQDNAVKMGLVDAIADDKCAVQCEQKNNASPTSCIGTAAGIPSKAEHAAVPSCLWMPVFAILASLAMHVALPYMQTKVPGQHARPQRIPPLPPLPSMPPLLPGLLA